MSPVKLMAGKCSTCIFRHGNPMRLREGRMAQIVAANREAGTALYCHLTTYGQQPEPVLCRGYFDAYGQETTSVQVITRLCTLTGDEPFEEVVPPPE